MAANPIARHSRCLVSIRKQAMTHGSGDGLASVGLGSNEAPGARTGRSLHTNATRGSAPTAAFRLLLLLLLASADKLVKEPDVDRVDVSQMLANPFHGLGPRFLEHLDHVGLVLSAARTKLGFDPAFEAGVAQAIRNTQVSGA